MSVNKNTICNTKFAKFQNMSCRYKSKMQRLCNCKKGIMPFIWFLAYAFTARRMLRSEMGRLCQRGLVRKSFGAYARQDLCKQEVAAVAQTYKEQPVMRDGKEICPIWGTPKPSMS